MNRQRNAGACAGPFTYGLLEPGLPAWNSTEARVSGVIGVVVLFEQHFHAIAFGLLAITFAGLAIARVLRARREDTVNEGLRGGWKFRAELALPVGDPYDRFRELRTNPPFDIFEGRDEGFEVSYFQLRDQSGPLAAAIVVLPVEGPRIQGHYSPHTPVGGRVGDVWRELGNVEVLTEPFALFVVSDGATESAVHRAALRLAHAIVADAHGGADGADGASGAGSTNKQYGKSLRLFGRRY